MFNTNATSNNSIFNELGHTCRRHELHLRMTPGQYYADLAFDCVTRRDLPQEYS